MDFSKLYYVVECINDNENDYQFLEVCKNLFEAEVKLNYYINHGYDAYLDYQEGS